MPRSNAPSVASSHHSDRSNGSGRSRLSHGRRENSRRNTNTAKPDRHRSKKTEPEPEEEEESEESDNDDDEGIAPNSPFEAVVNNEVDLHLDAGIEDPRRDRKRRHRRVTADGSRNHRSGRKGHGDKGKGKGKEEKNGKKKTGFGSWLKRKFSLRSNNKKSI